MGKQTNISWCHHTFNHVRGCTKVSAGCANCYAERDSKRNPGVLGIWGPQGTRVLAVDPYWRQALRWDSDAASRGERRRVFCASLADVFEQWDGPVVNSRGEAGSICDGEAYWNAFPDLLECHRAMTMDDARLRLFDTIRRTPHLDWLLLTKRPETIGDTLRRCYLSAGTTDLAVWLLEWLEAHPPANVWLGTSVEDQETADARIPHLLKIPAAVRWISYEPALGPVDFSPFFSEQRTRRGNGIDWHGAGMLHWVIVGGESGAIGKARPFDLAWARDTIRQCKAAGATVFCKQLGASPFDSASRISIDGPRSHAVALSLLHKAGADPAEWPSDLNVQQFPATAPATP